MPAVSTALNKPTIDRGLKLHFPDTLDLLSEFDTKRYRLQRRLIGPVYQASNVKNFEHSVDGVIERSVAQLRTLDGAEVDLKEWMHIIVVECLGAVVLSWSPGYIAAKSDAGTSTQGYIGWRMKSVFGLFPVVTTASFFSRGLRRAFSNLWRVTFSAPKNFKPFFTVSSKHCPLASEYRHLCTYSLDSRYTTRSQRGYALRFDRMARSKGNHRKRSKMTSQVIC